MKYSTLDAAILDSISRAPLTTRELTEMYLPLAIRLRARNPRMVIYTRLQKMRISNLIVNQRGIGWRKVGAPLTLAVPLEQLEFPLPEGGSAMVFWPITIHAASIQALAEMIQAAAVRYAAAEASVETGENA